MKKLLALLLAMSMCAGLAACGGSDDTAGDEGDAGATENVIKIGVFEPSSGDSGAGGKQEILGMQYANSLTPTVTAGGVEYTVELVYADNGSSVDKAPTAAQTLVSEGVVAVMGSYGSSVAIAGAPYFDEAGIPALAVTATNPQVTAGNPLYFRLAFLDPFQGTVQANLAVSEFGADTAYVLAELGNDYDVGLATYFTEAFEANGGTVINETFPTNTADFSSYLATAATQGADVIFAPCSISYATQIVSQSAALGTGLPILAPDTWDNNKIVEAAQGTDSQIYVSTFYQEGGNPDFDTNFKAYVNSDSTNLKNNGGNDMISAVSAMGYDAYNTIITAITDADSVVPADIAAALWNVNTVGVCGNIVFEQENGDAIRDTAYIKSINTETNSWNLLKEQGV